MNQDIQPGTWKSLNEDEIPLNSDSLTAEKPTPYSSPELVSVYRNFVEVNGTWCVQDGPDGIYDGNIVPGQSLRITPEFVQEYGLNIPGYATSTALPSGAYVWTFTEDMYSDLVDKLGLVEQGVSDLYAQTGRISASLDRAVIEGKETRAMTDLNQKDIRSLEGHVRDIDRRSKGWYNRWYGKVAIAGATVAAALGIHYAVSDHPKGGRGGTEGGDRVERH